VRNSLGTKRLTGATTQKNERPKCVTYYGKNKRDGPRKGLGKGKTFLRRPNISDGRDVGIFQVKRGTSVAKRHGCGKGCGGKT